MKRLFQVKDVPLWTLIPISIAAAGVVALMFGTPRSEHQKLLAAKLAAVSEGRQGSNLGTASQFADSLLTDSILSIIQSYYVDPGRVDNRGLLDAVLETLGTSPDISHGRVSSSASAPDGVASAEEFWVEIAGDRRVFTLPADPTYQDVLSVFNNVSSLIDSKRVQIPATEPGEKNAPGSVVLLNSLLSALDSHSSLMSPDAYRELRQGTEGSFGGLGVLVGIRENLLTVIKPLPRSPAQRAGIHKRDRILGINGVYTYGYTLDELVEYMRGDPGTAVKLSLLRDGAIAPTELTLRREIIHVDSVTSEEIVHNGSNILHATIENFASRTSRELLTAIKKFRLRHYGKMDGMVLDLRSNPGGLLDQAVQVADLFLQEGVIVSTKGRREEVENAGSGFDEVDFPLIVLIDGDSASASEIVAGALQDHGRALVIGQPSFGKGSVQTIFELPGERALKLTIARYYTPSGRSIQNVGIIPDVWLQPVYMSTENNNLLGMYRYKNERFLRNHLLGHAGKAAAETAVKQPARKAYYLEDAPHDPEDPVRPVDREMSLALQVISKVHDTYGSKLPSEAGRASHWLGLAGPVLGKSLDQMNATTKTWLNKKFAVSWPAAAPVDPDADVGLVLKNTVANRVKPGDSVTLNWSLTNNESEALQHVSLFVRSDVGGFETKETLIGSVSAHGSREGQMTIQIPTYFEPGPVLLRLGVALDAWPASRASIDVPLEVEARQVADLTAAIVLANEQGGQIAGRLEPSERASVRLEIQNQGATPAHDLKVYLTNLSGKQLKLKSKPLTIKQLGVGERSESFVEIEAAKVLYSSELALGLYVESTALKLPYRQRVVLPSVPTNGALRVGLLPEEPLSH